MVMNAPHVIIIGAGLAGLTAAYELQRRGFAYSILEAETSHLGGRIRTLRLGDDANGAMIAEAGAMRIPGSHSELLAFIADLGVQTHPFDDNAGDGYAYLRGTSFRKRDTSAIAKVFGLDPGKLADGTESLWQRVLWDVLRDLSPAQRQQLFDDRPTCERVLDMDQCSLLGLLEKSGLSADEIELVGSLMALEPLLDSAATEHLREELTNTWSSGFFTIGGGMNALPEAIAARLAMQPIMGSQVVRISRRRPDNRVTVTFLKSDRLHEIAGDVVLCTVPCPVIPNIDFDPPLHSVKQRAIRQVRYESALKVFAVTKYRFWETDHRLFGGSSCTDLPTGMTYYPSDNVNRDPRISQSPGVLLASYTWGTAARRLGALSDSSMMRSVRSCMGALHGCRFDEAMFQDLQTWNWDNHPWSGGGFAMFSPGQHARLYNDLVSHDGPIYFAGEHTSLQHSWMQGALESARRAVTSITNRERLH